MSASEIMKQAAIVALTGNLRDNHLKRVDIYTLLQVLGKNKIPLIGMEIDSQKIEIFERALREEHNYWEKLRREYVKIKSHFYDAGINDIMIKSCGILPYTSDNLDVLIKPECKHKAITVLQKLGYVRLVNLEEPFKFFFRKFNMGREICTIHLHERVGWGGIPFLDDNSLWKRCRRSAKDSLLKIPSVEDGLLITAAHAFFENREVKLADLVIILRYFEEYDVDWDYMESIAKKRGWLYGLYTTLMVCAHLARELYEREYIDQKKLRKMARAVKGTRLLSFYLRAMVHPRKIKMPFHLPLFWGSIHACLQAMFDRDVEGLKRIQRFAYFMSTKFKEIFGVSLQRAMLITFSGIDGSGKTLQAEALMQALRVSGIKTCMVWSRVGYSPVLKLFADFARLFLHKSDGSGVSKQYSGRLKKQKRSAKILYLLLIYSNLILYYWLKVRISLFLGRVVVCDRYILDAMADMDPFDRWKIGEKFMLLCHRPDMPFFLEVPVKVALARKKDEIHAPYFQDRVDIYQQLAKKFHLLTRDATGRPEVLSEQILSEVLMEYFAC